MSWGKPLKYLHKSQGNITSNPIWNICTVLKRYISNKSHVYLCLCISLISLFPFHIRYCQKRSDLTERKKQKTRNNVLVHPIRHFKSLVIRGLPISNVLAVWLFYMLYHPTCTSWITEFFRNGTSCSAPHSVLLRNTIGDKCTMADFNDISNKVMLDITTVHSPVF